MFGFLRSKAQTPSRNYISATIEGKVDEKFVLLPGPLLFRLIEPLFLLSLALIFQLVT